VQFSSTGDSGSLTDLIKVDRWGRFSSTNAAIDFAFRPNAFGSAATQKPVPARFA
jgi:type IV fimbrial biogenesis protein FimT